MDMEQGIILIVDDNPTNLGVLSEGLSDSGFEVLIAQDGESAIERVDYAHPDIILLDVLMPGIEVYCTTVSVLFAQGSDFHDSRPRNWHSRIRPKTTV
jgi:CheY-like chemotaxis protein